MMDIQTKTAKLVLFVSFVEFMMIVVIFCKVW